ncbi:PIN domain-containing protein [Sorangium sp. So ce321]|uniref:PIN domain-containing protein n=1 Tax=Sorangium sp. So ce321 TaxID=3133300 RepID=UPI003F6000FE
MGPNLTFDSGALIALEGRRANLLRIVATATADDKLIFVPQVVLAEWWRGWSKHRAEILRSVRLDPLTDAQAKAAGEALAALGEDTERKGSKLTIDALVMASASSRGDIVYTSDPSDLERLLDIFKGVKRIEKV